MEKLKGLVRQAPACDSFTRNGRTHVTEDGVGYRHFLHDRHEGIYARWANPDPESHPVQTRLIEAYMMLIDLHNGVTEGQ